MQSSGPPPQGADHSSSTSKSGKVQISRGGFVGATGDALYSLYALAQGDARLGELASAELSPPVTSSPLDEASQSVIDLSIGEVQFLRGTSGAASGITYSSGQDD